VKRFVVVSLLVLLIPAVVAPSAFAADKTQLALAALQQSVDRLQADLRDMRSTTDERMGRLITLIEQQTATVNKLSGAMDQVQRNVQDTVSRAMATQGTKVDAVSGDVRALNETLATVTTQIRNLSQQVAALKSTMETMQAMPPPVAAQPVQAQPPPAPAPDILYGSAVKDLVAGNFGMAVSEFQDFLKAYPNSDQASEAQYNIGLAYFNWHKYDDALEAFKLVIDRYQKAPKAPDALYKRGLALIELNKPKAAEAEFNTLIKLYPRSDSARLAREQVKLLNQRGATAPPAAKPAAKAASKSTVRPASKTAVKRLR
jgi:tol-pal system protein YbgF